MIVTGDGREGRNGQTWAEGGLFSFRSPPLLSELCLAAFASRNNEEERRLPRNRMCHWQAAATNGPKHKSLTASAQWGTSGLLPPYIHFSQSEEDI